MRLPQIIIIVMYSLSVLLSFYQSGKTKDYVKAISSLVMTMIVMGLLIWGGFFG